MDLLILIFSVLGNLTLGLLVYLKNPRSATNNLFAALSGALILLVTANYFSVTVKTPDEILLWIRLTMAAASVVAYFYTFFVITFPKTSLNVSIFRALSAASFSLLTVFIALTPYLFTNIQFVNGSPVPRPGPGIALFLLTTILPIVASITFLFLRTRKATGLEKYQLNFVLLGTAAMFGLIIGTIFIPVNLFNFSLFTPFTPLYTLVFVATTAYAIIRHKLLDVRLVVARAVAYTLLVTVLFGFFVVSTILATSFFIKTPTPLAQVIMYSVLAILVGYGFGPLRDFFERLTDKIFFKEKYDSSELLLSLTKVMATTLGLGQLLGGLLERLLPEMRVGKGAFVLLKKGKIESVKSVGFPKETTFISSEMSELFKAGKLLISDDLEEGKLRTILKDIDAVASIPLKVGPENELGVLLLGHKLSGEIYTNQDVTLLQILEPEISVALQNAKAYEEIKNFNITLQEEIRKATSELRDANERLKELDQLKDEFLSIASHELRTPMTAIKSYIWLALHGRAGKLSTVMQDYLDKVYSSSERMIALINDMLNVSRIETGRLQMEPRPVSVYKVADQVFGDLAARSTETGVKLVLNKDNAAPPVMADPDKLAEIYTNLIGNSLKFTKSGGVVTVRAEKVEKMIQVSIQDTGVGIAKENLNKLFQKYGKLGDSYATMAASSSSGTGLGLYITKQYIEKMGGTIKVESTLGKGTTFVFTLPIATSEDLKSHPESEPQPQGIFINPQMAGQFGISPAFMEAQKKEMAKNEKKAK